MSWESVFGDHRRSLAAELEQRLERQKARIAEAERGALDNVDALVEAVVVEAPVPDFDNAHTETEDRPGMIEVSAFVPTSGDLWILRYPPAEHPDERPEAAVEVSGFADRPRTIRFLYKSETIDATDFKSWRTRQFDLMSQWVAVATDQINAHNDEASTEIKKKVADRLERLSQLEAFKRDI